MTANFKEEQGKEKGLQLTERIAKINTELNKIKQKQNLHSF